MPKFGDIEVLGEAKVNGDLEVVGEINKEALPFAVAGTGSNGEKGAIRIEVVGTTLNIYTS